MHKATYLFIKEILKMEEKKQEKRKTCSVCGKFTRYYTKGTRRFEPAKFGFCYEQNNIVKSDGGCENQIPNHRRISVHKRAVSRALCDILAQLSAIRQIVCINQEEEK